MWVFGVVCFALSRVVRLFYAFRGLRSWPAPFSMDWSRGRFSEDPRTAGASGRGNHGSQETGSGVPEFRHPDPVAYLLGLTSEATARHSPTVRERDGVFRRYWRIGCRVRCREVEASGASASEMDPLPVLMQAAASEFGRSLSLVAAGFWIWTPSRR